MTAVAKGDLVQISNVTNWSVAVGVIAALLQFGVTTVVASQMDDLPFFYLPLILLSPFATFFLIAAVAHRRRVAFVGAAETMRVETVVFGLRFSDPVSVPLDQVDEITFHTRWNGEAFFGLVRLHVEPHRVFKLAGNPAELRGKCDAILSMINSARARTGQDLLPPGPACR